MPEAPRPDDDLTAVFVYGTLRPGRSNWPVAQPFCAHHEPATLPRFGLYELAYPAIAPLLPDAPDRDSACVRGDLLWLVRDRVSDALERLDAFEGVDGTSPRRSYYERSTAVVTVDHGDRHRAWVYLPGHLLQAEIDESRRVAGDDWPV